MFGYASPCLYAVWSNPAPGVAPDRFREYYEDIHRPDTLALGHFDRSYRYQAQGECRARYLTLWEAEYPDLPRALERVRAGALALQKQGRIWPVQEVVFHQFVFLWEQWGESRDLARSLTTVQNDWGGSAPLSAPEAWARTALPRQSELTRYGAQYLYAHATRFVWLGETGASIDARLWRAGESGLPPLGRATPIFPDSAVPAIGDEPAADPDRAWVMHWSLVS